MGKRVQFIKQQNVQLYVLATVIPNEIVGLQDTQLLLQVGFGEIDIVAVRNLRDLPKLLLGYHGHGARRAAVQATLLDLGPGTVQRGVGPTRQDTEPGHIEVNILFERRVDLGVRPLRFALVLAGSTGGFLLLGGLEDTKIVPLLACPRRRGRHQGTDLLSQVDGVGTDRLQ